MTPLVKTTPENDDLIGEMRKNNRAACAASTLVEFSNVVCANDIVKFPNLRFQRHRQHPTVIFHSLY